MCAPVPLRLLLLGYGNVARALLPFLASRRAWLEHEFGVYPVVVGLGSRSLGLYVFPDGLAPVSLSFEGTGHSESAEIRSLLKACGKRVESVQDFISAGKMASASVFIELTTLNPHDGQPALAHVQAALHQEMHVITANKGPIAYALADLQALARQTAVQLRFESTVLGGFPLFNLAQFTLPSLEIRAFRALLNTTSNIVLGMLERGTTLSHAIQQAQDMGFAEADPWYDLDGWDSTMKTTILANTLLQGHVPPSHVARAGIRDLPLEEIQAAAALGTPLRLVSQATHTPDGLVASVGPQPIAAHDSLRPGVDPATTGTITLDVGEVGPITLVEQAPDVLQTAYGIFSDLVTILRTRKEAS